VRGWQERAVLAPGSDRDPIAGQHVLAHRRCFAARVEGAGVDAALRAESRVGVVEIHQLAAIGEMSGALDDAGAERFGGDVRHVHVNTVTGRAW
jgi:hypothetical protein